MDIYFYLGLAVIALVCAAYFALVHYCNKRPQKEIVYATSDNEEKQGNALIKRFCDDNKSSLRRKLEKMLPPNAKQYSTRRLQWFEAHTKEICHDGYCLKYLEEFNNLEQLFWKNVEKQKIDVAHDETFQRLIISINTPNPLGLYGTNFNYLLFAYGSRYKLLPQFIEVINKDGRFKYSKNMYDGGKNYRKLMGKPFLA